MNDKLDAAYRATSYVVFAPDGNITLRIDATSTELDTVLQRHGVHCWAFVTACNPGSTPLSDDENRNRDEELRQSVSAAGYLSYAGQGVGDDDAWPPEPSLLILGITPQEADRLGRRFGQNAILIGERGRPARLWWL